MRPELRKTRTVRKLTQKIVSGTTRNGKRTRRAVLKLRHGIVQDMFRRWLAERVSTPVIGGKTYRVYPQLWHEWHALGKPWNNLSAT